MSPRSQDKMFNLVSIKKRHENNFKHCHSMISWMTLQKIHVKEWQKCEKAWPNTCFPHLKRTENKDRTSSIILFEYYFHRNFFQICHNWKKYKIHIFRNTCLYWLTKLFQPLSIYILVIINFNITFIIKASMKFQIPGNLIPDFGILQKCILGIFWLWWK